jgi:outer membrane protein assembly factor BamB
MRLATAIVLLTTILAAGCRKSETPPASKQDASAAAIGGLAWPIFRGDQALCGVAHGRLPDTLKLKWRFKAEDSVKSSAVIASGMVFIGSDDGRLYAIDAAAGKQVWAFETKDAIEAPPLVMDGIVYIGSRDTFFYAIDAATGSLKWKYETDAEITGSANWTLSPDGKTPWIIVGSHDFNLYCFKPDGAVVWTYESDNFINGAPAVFDGKVFFGGCDALIHEVSLADGTRAGQIETGSYIAASAAVADNSVYVGNYGNAFVCGDLAEHRIAWEFTKSEDAFFSSPAVRGDVVLVGCRDDRLYCLSRTDGSALWSFHAKGDIDSSPVICGDKAVFGCEDGRLYIVRLADGKLVWSYDTGQPIISSPAVAAGMVVVGCDDGFVYAFSAP